MPNVSLTNSLLLVSENGSSELVWFSPCLTVTTAKVLSTLPVVSNDSSSCVTMSPECTLHLKSWRGSTRTATCKSSTPPPLPTTSTFSGDKTSVASESLYVIISEAIDLSKNALTSIPVDCLLLQIPSPTSPCPIYPRGDVWRVQVPAIPP